MRISALIFAAAVSLAGGSALAAGDAVKGAAVFQNCALCHNADKDGGNGLGPNLYRVVGRKAASLPNFPYSSALKSSGIIWTDNKLRAWVSDPARLVPGTRMMFPGLSDKQQIDDLIAYLHSRK
jgi:cytochrome c